MIELRTQRRSAIDILKCARSFRLIQKRIAKSFRRSSKVTPFPRKSVSPKYCKHELHEIYDIPTPSAPSPPPFPSSNLPSLHYLHRPPHHPNSVSLPQLANLLNLPPSLLPLLQPLPSKLNHTPRKPRHHPPKIMFLDFLVSLKFFADMFGCDFDVVFEGLERYFELTVSNPLETQETKVCA